MHCKVYASSTWIAKQNSRTTLFSGATDGQSGDSETETKILTGLIIGGVSLILIVLVAVAVVAMRQRR